MTPRVDAVQVAGHRSPTNINGSAPRSSAEQFGSHVFGPNVMRKMLPAAIVSFSTGSFFNPKCYTSSTAKTLPGLT